LHSTRISESGPWPVFVFVLSWLVQPGLGCWAVRCAARARAGSVRAIVRAFSGSWRPSVLVVSGPLVLCWRSRGSRGTIDSHSRTHVRIYSPSQVRVRSRGFSSCVSGVCLVFVFVPALFAAPRGQRAPGPWWRWRTHPTLIPRFGSWRGPEF